MRITEVGEQGDPELQSPGEGLSQAQERTTEKVGTKQVSGSLFSMGDPHPCVGPRGETPIHVRDPGGETPIRVRDPGRETPIRVQDPGRETPIHVQDPGRETPTCVQDPGAWSTEGGPGSPLNTGLGCRTDSDFISDKTVW